VKKITYNSRDIEIFPRGLLFLAHPVRECFVVT